MSSSHKLGMSVVGEGTAETVVLVHGLFGDRRNLGVLARPLSERYKVVSIDLPNHGESARVEPGSIERMAEVIAEFLASLDEPVHYIGHSLGGKVGFRLASAFPHLLKSFVALDIAPVDYPTHDHGGILAGIQAVVDAHPADRREADDILAKTIETPAVRQFLLKSFVGEAKRGEGGSVWMFQSDILIESHSLIIGAPQFEQAFDKPAMVVYGANSDYVLPDYESEIIKWLPASKTIGVDGAGHWLHAERTAEVVSVVMDFLGDPR